MLNQAVKGNRDRFPTDFMFRLTKDEKTEVVTNCDHLQKLKFSPVLPHAFTEHGAVMLASVLNSKKAIQISVYVVRAFVKLREVLSAHPERLSDLNNPHASPLPPTAGSGVCLLENINGNIGVTISHAGNPDS
jgi:hypothetical protein